MKNVAYSTEEDVYSATGMNTTVVQNLSGKNAAEVTTLIDDYIAKADDRIKRLMKIPISIRKEKHWFDGRNFTVELGPDQDDFEVFDYDPENCVEVVYALFSSSKRRIKLPYPKDCDKLTEDITDMASSNVTLAKEETIVKCGDASIKATWTAIDGYFAFPTNSNLNKNLYPWTYVGFWFRTSNKDAKFKLRLYSDATTYNEWEFQLTLADVWYVVSVPLNEFDTQNINWCDEGVRCQEIRIYCDTNSTVGYFDNFNFNEGFFWTYPEGLLCWSKDQDDQYPTETLYVTYAYDPYKVTVPEVVEQASAKLAGVYLLDYLIGIRIRTVGFEQMSESLEFDPDREVLVAQRNKVQKEAEELLATIGYGTPQGIG